MRTLHAHYPTMEEQEVPLDDLEDEINEGAEHARSERTRWTFWVALSTALISVLAAISSLLASHNSDEALIEQIKSSDQWSFYQAKGIKSDMLQTKVALLAVQAQLITIQDSQKLAQYSNDQKEIRKLAEEHQRESEVHQTAHGAFARSVTLFQIAIALSAIAILSKRKVLWYGSLGMAGVGIFFLSQALL
jgi:hypothetical protein